MAALSVERARVGKATRRLRRAASAGEAGAQFAVGGHSSGDQNAVDAKRFLRGEGLLHQVTDHCVLKACNQVECPGVAGCQRRFHRWADRRFGSG